MMGCAGERVERGGERDAEDGWRETDMCKSVWELASPSTSPHSITASWHCNVSLYLSSLHLLLASPSTSPHCITASWHCRKCIPATEGFEVWGALGDSGF